MAALLRKCCSSQVPWLVSVILLAKVGVVRGIIKENPNNLHEKFNEEVREVIEIM